MPTDRSAAAKKTVGTKKGIASKSEVIIRPGRYSNRLLIDVKLSKEDEQCLLNMLQKRYRK